MLVAANRHEITTGQKFNRELAFYYPEMMIVLTEQESGIGPRKGDFGFVRAKVVARRSLLRASSSLEANPWPPLI
jgi:hypothetical protein